MRRASLGAVLAVTVLLLGACGTADDGAETSPASEDDRREPAATEAVSSSSIADVLAADGRFVTFIEQLESTNVTRSGRDRSLLEILDDLEGRDWTVFAPTDAAFDALGAGAAQSLVEGPWLFSVLHRHLVPDLLRAADLETGDLGSDGGMVEVVVSADGVTYGGVAVGETDIEAANGLIHVLDGVVLPPHVREDIGAVEP